MTFGFEDCLCSETRRFAERHAEMRKADVFVHYRLIRIADIASLEREVILELSGNIWAEMKSCAECALSSKVSTIARVRNSDTA